MWTDWYAFYKSWKRINKNEYHICRIQYVPQQYQHIHLRWLYAPYYLPGLCFCLLKIWNNETPWNCSLYSAIPRCVYTLFKLIPQHHTIPTKDQKTATHTHSHNADGGGISFISSYLYITKAQDRKKHNHVLKWYRKRQKYFPTNSWISLIQPLVRVKNI